ncbi:MAG: polysaccharide deacetylase family protein [Planctomycetota bacterium]|nr:polysaccharide deacetylase family protein [Planctomycetota bacterium]MDP7252746.1 polysaccharide deacetylase family protein [Planctomycetota bacterium]
MSSKDSVELIVRGDDFGFCHAANVAVERCFREGILTDTSLMVCTPWFEEAADICRGNPEFSVGVHTTLTAEWLFYKWGPVLPAAEVPSLVDEEGFFWPRTADFLEGNPEPDEVEAELRAQVEKALRFGLEPTYMDYHMATAKSTPELESVLKKVAADYRLPISGYVEDEGLRYPTDIDFDKRPAATAEMLRNLEPGRWRIVTHPGLDVPEMQAIRPAWQPESDGIAKSRASDTEILTAREVANAIRERGIRLVNYREIRDRMRDSEPCR